MKQGHGTSEDEGDGWRTGDAGITVWEGRADHSLFLWQGFFLISQKTTLLWPSLIDCTDTWINCAWKTVLLCLQVVCHLRWICSIECNQTPGLKTRGKQLDRLYSQVGEQWPNSKNSEFIIIYFIYSINFVREKYYTASWNWTHTKVHYWNMDRRHSFLQLYS